MNTRRPLTAAGLGLLGAIGGPSAAAPLLHAADEPPEEALARAAGLLDGPAEPAVIASFTAGRPPSLTGVGELGVCAAAPRDAAAIEALVADAEGALAYVEDDRALSLLGQAASALTCLSEPLAPPLAARIYYLRGVALVSLGDRPGAWGALQQAVVFDPDLVWDEDFPPDGEPTLAAARAELAHAAPARLTLVAGGPRFVDGRAVAPRAPGVAPLGAAPHLGR